MWYPDHSSFPSIKHLCEILTRSPPPLLGWYTNTGKCINIAVSCQIGLRRHQGCHKCFVPVKSIPREKLFPGEIYANMRQRPSSVITDDRPICCLPHEKLLLWHLRLQRGLEPTCGVHKRATVVGTSLLLHRMLTRDLLAIAKFLVFVRKTRWHFFNLPAADFHKIWPRHVNPCQLEKHLNSEGRPIFKNKKLSYRREASRALCCWVFWLVAEGCSK